jgi:hypothetical protein
MEPQKLEKKTLRGIEYGKDAPVARKQTKPQVAEPDAPFSIYSSREKKFIVFMASLAALLSPLSANIYYPALNILSDELSVSLTLINLTITTYLVSKVAIPFADTSN